MGWWGWVDREDENVIRRRVVIYIVVVDAGLGVDDFGEVWGEYIFVARKECILETLLRHLGTPFFEQRCELIRLLRTLANNARRKRRDLVECRLLPY